jgi:hypothetical protein
MMGLVTTIREILMLNLGMKLPDVSELRKSTTDKVPSVDCKFGQKRISANSPNQSTEPRVGGSNPSGRTNETQVIIEF